MITWLYNDVGHIEIWEGEVNPYNAGRESDVYIQNDVEVDDFIELMGAGEYLELDVWDNAEDIGYFNEEETK